MKLPRRRFLQLAAGAAALPAVGRIARAQDVSWNSLGGGLTSAPALCTWGGQVSPAAAYRRDVFARGEDFALWHKWYGWFPDRNVFTWSEWESLGGVLNFGPAVSSWGPRRLDVFARGTDNTIFQRTFDHGWRAWTSIAEPETTVALPGIAAVSSAPGKIDLFTWGATHVNNQGTPINFLQHKSYRDGWKAAQTIGLGGAAVSLSTSLAVASWREDRLDWFLRGADNALQHSAGLVGGGGQLGVNFWEKSRGGFLTSGPAAVAAGRSGFEEARLINVAVRGSDNALWDARLLSESPD